MVGAAIRAGKMENKCDHFGERNDRTGSDGLGEKGRGVREERNSNHS